MRRVFLPLVIGLLLVSMLSLSIACSLNGQDGDETTVDDVTASAGETADNNLDQSVGLDESTSKTSATGTTADATAESTEGVLQFGIGMHIEPRGATPSSLVGGNNAGPTWVNKGDYSDPAFFQQHVEDIKSVAAIVEGHQGSMTVQAQTPFTTVAVSTGNSVLSDLAASGHEIALHFHAAWRVQAAILKNPAGYRQ